MAASIRTSLMSRVALELMLKRSIATSAHLLKNTRRLKYADSEEIPKLKRKAKTHEPKKIYTVDEVDALLNKRFPPENIKVKGMKPIDDVWVFDCYPPVHYTFQECVEMHRAACCKEMFDNEKGLLTVDTLLCMRTKKRTKFTNNYNGTLMLPHLFETGIPKKKILALSASDGDIEVAKSYGATMVGSAAIIKKIESNELVLDDIGIDLVICATDLLHKLLSIKDKLPEFPHKNTVTTGHDMESMISLHTNGVAYQSTMPRKKSRQDLENPTIQNLTVPIGRLNMPIDQLEENWNTWKEKLNSHRESPALGPVLLTAHMKCSPSPESLQLDLLQDQNSHAEKETVAHEEDHEEDDDDDEDDK